MNDVKPKQTPIISTPPENVEKKYIPKMKEWSDDPTELVPYDELISPLKSVLEAGYNLYRKAASSFDYDGYNIGKEDNIHTPSPKVRLTDTMLAFEKKRFNRNLIDVVLNIAFMLGIEQGRRTKSIQSNQIDSLIEHLELLKEENKALRIRNDELEVIQNAPNSDNIPKQLDEKRRSRISLLKSRQDKAFNIKSTVRLKFKEMVKIIKSLDEKLAKQQYVDVLRANGWSHKEYLRALKK